MESSDRDRTTEHQRGVGVMETEKFPRSPMPGDALRHPLDCEWHVDQYPAECTCGLTAPRPEWSTLTPRDGSPYPPVPALEDGSNG